MLNAASEDAIDASFETMNRDKAGAVVVASTAFFFSRRKQLIVLAARHAIPAIYQLREFTTDGGLMSYGASATVLPVVQPSILNWSLILEPRKRLV